MISVALTTYNGEKFVIKQLESIVNQSLEVDEIIICDDASSDGTVAAIKRFIETTSFCGKIALFETSVNVGYTANFYKAISLTHGDYIFLSDQDDMWFPDKVHLCMQKIKDVSCGLLCSNVRLIDSSDEILNDENLVVSEYMKKKGTSESVLPVTAKDLWYNNIAPGCTYCFSKEIKEIYLKVRDPHLIHDYQLMLIAALQHRAYYWPQKSMAYRIHANNAIGAKSTTNEKMLHITIRKDNRVAFLESLDKVEKVKHLWLWKCIYWLKLPSWRRKFQIFFKNAKPQTKE